MDEIVRAGGLIGFRRLVRELGGDPGSILASVGLNDEMLGDPDRYIPYRKVLLAFEVVADRLDVTDFGLRLASRQDLDFLGMLSLAIQSARNIREALLVAGRNMRYHTPSVSIQTGERSTGGIEMFGIEFLLKNAPAIPQATEHAVWHMANIVNLLSQGSARPESIHFRHDRVSDTPTYERCFGQMPHFNSAFDGIALKVEVARRRVPGENRQLQTFVERFIIGVSPDTSLTIDRQVRETLRNLMRVQQPRIDVVARILHLHPRTLQRRLADRKTSFERLSDDVRRGETMTLLKQSVPLAIVARTVGFSDQAALNRACRRWFGATPAVVRRQQFGLRDLDR